MLDVVVEEVVLWSVVLIVGVDRWWCLDCRLLLGCVGVGFPPGRVAPPRVGEGFLEPLEDPRNHPRKTS